MATLVGGPSNTIPSEFQALWITKLLIDVIRGDALWVRIEPGEAVAPKSECIVRRLDGTTEAHQCKRQRRSKGVWSVADLEAESIISAANQYLAESPHHRFWFVSGDPAPALRTLCERAAQFDRIDQFRAEAATNDATRRDFGTLAALFELDRKQDRDLEQLRDFLARFRPVIVDVLQQRREIEELVSRWIQGDPALAVHALEHLANKTVRRQLDLDAVKDHLESNGFRLRDLTQDVSLPLQLSMLCDQYIRSFTPYLIGGRPLGRPEAGNAITALESPSVKLVLIHGSGGAGKSGILYETLIQIRDRGNPCLVVRLDQEDLGRTPAELGKRLGLPASPAACIASIAGGRQAVLLIDQLDAVRWTSRHSPHALEMVAQLVESALEGGTKVVVACRTFDANHDDIIRTLVARLEHTEKCLRRIDATLSDDARDSLLDRIGIAVTALSPRQRETLRSLQNIWLLAKLRADTVQTSFVSGTDLNRAYWAWVRRHFSDTELITLNDRILPDVIDRPFETGNDAIPVDIYSRHETIIHRLLSIGALVQAGPKSIRFAHQTQFDFLAAERLSEHIRRGVHCVTDWARSHDEIFHRNQLRQLLEMMRDDTPCKFLAEIKAIVLSANVRFHLKQLALQVLGSTESPTEAELSLLLEFNRVATLSPHVQQLFFGSVAWFDLLHARRLIESWANSDHVPTRNFALWLMRRLLRERGDKIHAVAQRMKPDSRHMTLESLLSYANPGELSNELFREYLKLVRANSPGAAHTDLKKLAAENPRRALAVFRAHSLQLLRTLRGDAKNHGERQEVESTILHDTQGAMLGVSKKLPQSVWSRLWVVAMQCQSLRIWWGMQPPGARASGYHNRQVLGQVLRLVEHMLVEAGRRLARRRPEEAWSLFERHLENAGRFEQRVALKCSAGLPKRFADKVLCKLSATNKRLLCGASHRNCRYNLSRTSPARHLLRRFGMIADPAVLMSVEVAVCTCVPSWERRNWRFAHEYGKSARQYPRIIFAAQFALLSAFPVSRLSVKGRDWLGVLSRKFGPVAAMLKGPVRNSGLSMVHSSIPEACAHRLSDISWLRLLRNSKVSPESRFRGRSFGDLTESTPELFARQLEHTAHREPTRFAEFALKMPSTSRPEYVGAILRALGKDKPPDGASADWASASVQMIEPVLGHFSGAVSGTREALDYCWVLHNRPEGPWGVKTLRTLVEVAIHHPDPRGLEAEFYSGSAGSEKQVPDYVTTSLNCVRAVAARAIGELLFENPGYLAELQPAIDAFLNDSHPSVRIAATRIGLAMLNINGEAAIDYCLRLNMNTSEAVLLGHELSAFLRYTVQLPRLKPVLRRMLWSRTNSIAQRGAEWSSLVYLHDGKDKGKLTKMLKRRLAYRRGIAEVLSRELVAGAPKAATSKLLRRLLNDSEREVRGTAARLFWHAEFYFQPHAVQLLEVYTQSAAFNENLGNVLYGLRETNAPLERFSRAISQIVKRLSSQILNSDSLPMVAAHHLPDVLLRLYDQSKPKSLLRKQCLDHFDTAVRDRLTHDLLPKIE
jgi:hypothetical protein